jgi:hypothetical protein
LDRAGRAVAIEFVGGARAAEAVEVWCVDEVVEEGIVCDFGPWSGQEQQGLPWFPPGREPRSPVPGGRYGHLDI